MKRIITLLFVLTTSLFYAQTTGITYQAVIYNPTGEILPGNNNQNAVLANKDVCLRFSIKDATTNLEYQETQKVKTDEFGMVNLVVGQGDQVGGYASNFDAILWNSSTKKLQVEMDMTGNCAAFIELSNQNFSAVPFAYASKTAENVSGIVAIANGGTGAATVSGAKTNLGLNNIDNTSDANKPISTATQTALDTKAPLASPALTGTPTVPTATIGSNTTQIANTAFVNTAIAAAATPDATDTVKGKLKLTGDLGGTADAPTVPGLANKENTIAIGATSQYYRGDKTWQTLDKTVVGLGNVNNTADADKPISTATQTALNGKENTIAAGTTSQYYRGDKTWQTLDKTVVGLGNVNNTADADKPISTATQTALNGKENTIAAGTTSQYYRGDKTWQTLDKTVVGLENVNNTADADKPISTATQTALDGKEDKSNKSTATTLGTSDELYPTQNAVKTYIDNALSTSNSNARATDLDMAGNSISNALAVRAGNFQVVDEVLHPFLGGEDPNAITILNRANNVTQFIDGRTGSPILAITNSVNEDDEFGTPTLEEGKLGIGTTTPSEKLQVIGNIKSQSFIKENGTATQFLKADGSVDENTYLTTTAATSIFEPIITAGTTAQYYRGDKTWQTLDKAAVGLSNVNNTADADKAISTATQTALDGKEEKSNKSTATTLGNSNDLYPTQNAVKVYVDNQIIAGVIDATDTVKGKIQLAGDLGGTADAPTVPGLANKENIIASGTTAQYYRGDKSWRTLDKAAVGLSNVNNTADADKAISTATQTALDLKANLASPTFTGDAKAATASVGDSDTSIATTAFVSSAITNAATPDATTTRLGKIQLAGDLAGTGSSASSPVISNNAITTSKIVDAAVTNAKIGETITVANGGTGATSLTGYLKGNGTSAFTTESTIPVANVAGAVRSVNGALPATDGNVSVLIGNVYTGNVITPTTGTTPVRSDIYIVAGQTGTPNDNGRTFIYDGTTWHEISTNIAALDNTFVKLSGSTMSGNLVFPTGNKITIADAPTGSTDVTNRGYVDTKIGGSGTTNFVPKFSAAKTLTDSSIFDDGTKVGIGTASPANTLEIKQGTSGNSGLRFTNLNASSTATTTSNKVLGVNSNGDVILTNVPGTQNIVSFSTATPTTSGVVFTPNTQVDQSVIYQSATDNSLWTYNGTTYVTYTAPATTAWNLAGTTNDAGNNKTTGIWRTGGIAVGGSSTTPLYGNITAIGGTNFSGVPAIGTASLGLINNSTAGWSGSGFLFSNSTAGSNAFSMVYNNDKAYFGLLTPSNGVNNFGTWSSTGLILGSNGNPFNRLDVVGGTAMGSYAGVNTAPTNGLIVSGNVGIGTTSPSANLQVNSNLQATNTINNNGQVFRMMRPQAPNIKWENIAQFNLGSYAVASSPNTNAFTRLDLAMNDGEGVATSNVMTWQANGNVGIRNTAPTAALDINSSTIASNTINADVTMLKMARPVNSGTKHPNIAQFNLGSHTAGGQSNTRLDLKLSNTIDTDIANVMTWQANGNIGIGTSTPAAQLHTTGSVRFAGAGTPGAGKVLTSDASGNATWQPGAIATTVSNKTTDFSLNSTDNGGVIVVNSSGLVTLTIPATLSSGFSCQIIQQGVGQVNVVGSGVTVTSALGTLSRTTGSSIGIMLTSSTSAFLSGDTAF